MDDVTVGIAGIITAALAYFGGVQRGKTLQRHAERHAERLRDEAWKREDSLRTEEESKKRVEQMVQHFQRLLTPAGGNHGLHLETLQEAGIRALSNGEIRAVLRELEQRTRLALPQREWNELANVDLKKLFTAAHGRINLSGGAPTLVGALQRLRSDGEDISAGITDARAV
jgi:hypothetical protein